MVRAKHRIGGYRVIAPIGAGGSATVYRALDESTGREVAIKVLAENHSLIPEMRRRFVEEVELLATVDSVSIAKIYEVGETDTGQPFMVLELADRGDLRRRLEEIRTSRLLLSRADLTMLAHHLYEALTTLHAADIVHRDVSPGNILIRTRRTGFSRDEGVSLLEPGERFLLADLGHAKDMELASGLTAGGGTRGFAAPEQRDDITMVDHRADIFSATAIMEWASHDGPFADDLESFFDKGLASEPEDRFANMSAWHEAFRAALGAGPGPEIAGRTQRLVFGALAGVVVGGLVAAWVVADRTREVIAGEYVDFDEQPVSPVNEQARPGDDADAGVATESGGAGASSDRPEVDPNTSVEGETARASFGAPTDDEVIDGDLVVQGAVTGLDENETVELAIHNEVAGGYWNPVSSKFQQSFHQFQVGLSDADGDGNRQWQYTVSSQFLEPATYQLRVWARGENAASDPSDVRTIIVNG